MIRSTFFGRRFSLFEVYAFIVVGGLLDGRPRADFDWRMIPIGLVAGVVISLANSRVAPKESK